MGGRKRRSTKRSDGKRSAKLPEPIVFFLDESVGRYKVASLLRDAGLCVEIHADHFPEGAPDTEWVPGASERGWVIFSTDTWIRRKANEREAVLNSGGRMFVFTGGEKTGEAAAEVFLGALPKIRRIIATRLGPFIATVTRKGHVGIRWPGKRPKRRGR